MPTTSLLRRVSGARGRNHARRAGAGSAGGRRMGRVIGSPVGAWSTRTAASSIGPSGGRLEDITEAPHGVDHRFPSGIDLLAQVGNVQLHDIGLTAEIVVPDPVQDLR